MYVLRIGDDVLFYHNDENYIENIVEKYNSYKTELYSFRRNLKETEQSLYSDRKVTRYKEEINSIANQIRVSFSNKSFDTLPSLYAKQSEFEKTLFEYKADKLKESKNALDNFEATIPPIYKKLIEYVENYNHSLDYDSSLLVDNVDTYEEFETRLLKGN